METVLVIWRLNQDYRGLFEGSCVSEAKYKGIWYADRCIFSPISEDEFSDWIEVKEQPYIDAHGLEKLLFYSQFEVNDFYKKLKHARYLN